MERGKTKNPMQPDSATLIPMAEEKARSRPAPGPSLTEWQRFFLTRLEHLLQVQREGTPPDDAHGTLLTRAVYSTYLDCQSQGVGEEALQRLGASGQPSAN